MTSRGGRHSGRPQWYSALSKEIPVSRRLRGRGGLCPTVGQTGPPRQDHYRQPFIDISSPFGMAIRRSTSCSINLASSSLSILPRLSSIGVSGFCLTDAIWSSCVDVGSSSEASLSGDRDSQLTGRYSKSRTKIGLVVWAPSFVDPLFFPCGGTASRAINSPVQP